MTNEEKLKLLYPPFAEMVQDFLYRAETEGLHGEIFAGLRTYDEQDLIYAQGRSKPGKKVTNAKAGQSYHNFGLAIDYVFIDAKGEPTWNGPYSIVGQFAKEAGLEWGGGWTPILINGVLVSRADRPHIQNTYKQDVRKLDYIYRQSLVSGAPLHAVWRYLDDVRAGRV